jgi:hypothetical protein
MFSVPDWARSRISQNYYSKPAGKVKEGISRKGRCSVTVRRRSRKGVGSCNITSKGKAFLDSIAEGREETKYGLQE